MTEPELDEPLWSRVDSVEHMVDAARLLGPDAQPCDGCVAPCCWNVKLMQLRAERWDDLEYITFLSGFPEIEIDYCGDAQFRFFYRSPCGFLDTTSGRFDCTLHGTGAKPPVCIGFDEHQCFYREGLLGTPEVGQAVLRLDHRRWRAVSELFHYDGTRGALTTLPSTAEAWAVVKSLPGRAPRPKRRSLGREALRCEPSAPTSYGLRRSPCDDCAATPCCTALLFERRPPTSRESLEFMRYQAGFPGIEITVSPTGWRTLVRTTCSFLDEETSRCTLYGLPERPTLCTHYNQFRCDYRRFFSAGADTVLRLTLAELQSVIDRAPVNSAGELPRDFGVAAVRGLLAGRSP